MSEDKSKPEMQTDKIEFGVEVVKYKDSVGYAFRDAEGKHIKEPTDDELRKALDMLHVTSLIVYHRFYFNKFGECPVCDETNKEKPIDKKETTS